MFTGAILARDDFASTGHHCAGQLPRLRRDEALGRGYMFATTRGTQQSTQEANFSPGEANAQEAHFSPGEAKGTHSSHFQRSGQKPAYEDTLRISVRLVKNKTFAEQIPQFSAMKINKCETDHGFTGHAQEAPPRLADAVPRTSLPRVTAHI